MHKREQLELKQCPHCAAYPPAINRHFCTESLQTVTQLVLQYFLLLLPLGYQTTSPSCGHKWLLLLTLHWTVYELL